MIAALGFDVKDAVIVVIGVIIVLIISILQEKGINIREKIAAGPVVARWGFYLVAVLCVIVFGAYGMNYIPVDPIYAGF